jgi:hypothetical protein
MTHDVDEAGLAACFIRSFLKWAMVTVLLNCHTRFRHFL